MNDAPERFAHAVMRVFAETHPDRPIPEKVAHDIERIHEAEVARLREALERIAGTTMSMVLDNNHGMRRMKDIARRALEDG